MASARAVRLSPSVEKQNLKLELLRGSRPKLESLPVSVVVHEPLVRAGCMFSGTTTRRTLTRLHWPALLGSTSSQSKKNLLPIFLPNEQAPTLPPPPPPQTNIVRLKQNADNWQPPLNGRNWEMFESKYAPISTSILSSPNPTGEGAHRAPIPQLIWYCVPGHFNSNPAPRDPHIDHVWTGRGCIIF